MLVPSRAVQRDRGVNGLKRWYGELHSGDQVLHICEDQAEQAGAVLDLLKWMDEDEKAVVFSDQWYEGRRSPSPVIDAALDDGRLEVRRSKVSLCASGRFHPEALAEIIELEYDQALEEGHSGLVAVADLSWLSASPQDLDQHIIQQSRWMLSSIPRSLTIVAQFQAKGLSAEQLDNLSRVYQMILRDKELTRNFYMVSTSALGGRPRTFNRTEKSLPSPADQDK